MKYCVLYKCSVHGLIGAVVDDLVAVACPECGQLCEPLSYQQRGSCRVVYEVGDLVTWHGVDEDGEAFSRPATVEVIVADIPGAVIIDYGDGRPLVDCGELTPRVPQ